jgi:DNA-directed RNA polymerase specialized sigma24 family protein
VAAVLGPRSADVADVAQEAFLRVHRNIPRFVYDEAKPAGPTAWINTIALRTALDHRAGLPPARGRTPPAGGGSARGPRSSRSSSRC